MQRECVAIFYDRSVIVARVCASQLLQDHLIKNRPRSRRSDQQEIAMVGRLRNSNNSVVEPCKE